MYYIVDTGKSFESASQDLEAAVKRHGFGVLHVHNIGNTLRGKGVAFTEECNVFEVCNRRPGSEGAVERHESQHGPALPNIGIYGKGKNEDRHDQPRKDARHAVKRFGASRGCPRGRGKDHPDDRRGEIALSAIHRAFLARASSRCRESAADFRLSRAVRAPACSTSSGTARALLDPRAST